MESVKSGTPGTVPVVIYPFSTQEGGFTVNRGEKVLSPSVIVNSTVERFNGVIVAFSQGSMSTNSTVNDSVTPSSFPVDEETS